VAELSPQDLATIERGRRAFVNRNRDGFLATLDPNIVIENLVDWPGPLRMEGTDDVWDGYADFFDQFESFDMEYANVEKVGETVLIDVHCHLTGLASGVPSELLWTLAGGFDSQAQRFTSIHWFHTHEEAVAWMSA
jgi:hypothetical protein